MVSGKWTGPSPFTIYHLPFTEPRASLGIFKLSKNARIHAPVFAHLDKQFQINSLSNQRFDLLACLRADALEELAVLADDDGALARFLDIDGRINVDEIVALFPVLDQHSGRMRNFLPRSLQDLFAHQ